MQVKTITVSAAGLASAGQGFQGAGLSDIKQVQAQSNNMFAPECRVTISQEGRNLSRKQIAQAETDLQSARSAAAEGNSLRRQEGMRNLREILMETFQEMGYSGQKLIDRVNEVYDNMCRPSHGDLQFSLNEPTEEAMAAVKELAQKGVGVEDIMIGSSRAQDLMQAAQEYQEYKA